MEQREELLGRYKDKLAHGIGPIGAAFCCVAWRLEQVNLISQMDEETVTAAFLGGVTSAFPLCSLVFGSGSDQPVECSWGQFHKSAKGSSDEDSEAHRGADFALVVWLTNEYARVAVFQAKKMEMRGLRRALAEVLESDEVPPANGVTPVETLPPVPEGKAYLNVHRRPTRNEKHTEEWREAQMVRLVRTGHEVIEAAKLKAQDDQQWAKNARDFAQKKDFVKDGGTSLLARLHWIHYLGYLDDEAICVPLSSMSKHVLDKELKNESFTVNAVEVKQGMQGVKPFVDLMVDGIASVSPSGELQDDVPGWKLMHADIVKAILPDLQSMMAVYIADDRGTMGPALRTEMSAGSTYNSVDVMAPPFSEIAPFNKPHSTMKSGM